MTIVSSGPVSIANINTELGAAATTQRDMNQTAVRTLLAVPSGAIGLYSAYGKSNHSFIINAVSDGYGYEYGYSDGADGLSNVIGGIIGGNPYINGAYIDGAYCSTICGSGFILSLRGYVSSQFFTSITINGYGTLYPIYASTFQYYGSCSVWTWFLSPIPFYTGTITFTWT